MITHDLGVVADMAERIIVMYAGKVVEEGSSEDIFYKTKHPYTRALLNSVPRLDLDEEKELEFIEGAPPDMTDPPKGCAFAARCKYCMNICLEEEPKEYSFGDIHKAKCWLYSEELHEEILVKIKKKRKNG